jgi:hypothetical protein
LLLPCCRSGSCSLPLAALSPMTVRFCWNNHQTCWDQRPLGLYC